MKIYIGIITCNRLAGLKNLLTSIMSLKTPEGSSLSVVVVDNDPLGSALEVVKQFNTIDLIYEIETKKGIPYARNKVLNLIPDNADYLAMVDDDEEVTPSWLEELIKMQKMHNSIAVIGSVYPKFSSEKNDFFVEYFTKNPYQNGETIKYGTTCNVLFEWSQFLKSKKTFEVKMRYTGGTDTLLFMKLASEGFISKFATNAVVYEYIPDSRANYDWVKLRAFREGITFVISSNLSGKNIDYSFYLKTLFFSVFVITFFSPFYFLSKISPPLFIRGALRFYRRLGVISAIFGFGYEEYK
jgi:GT2 family glycosyltransferase